MRTKTIILIVIALGCGLVASIGISEVLKQKPVSNLEMEAIIVAAVDLDIGTKLDAQNVKLEDWPKGKIPADALRTIDEVADQYCNTRLFAGEPILTKKLMDTSDPSATVKIPDGYVVLPVKIELDTVIGLIQPGDLVDVMVFLRQGPDIPRTDTYTILRMVRVFAVNSQTDRTVDEKGREVGAKTVSLLVKPRQSEKLTLAMELGKIRLALRRPTDEIADESEIDSLLPAIFRVSGGQVAMDLPKQETTVATPVATEPVAPPPPVVIAPPPPAPAPKWQMRIMTPHEVKNFHWTDERALPDEGGPAQLIQGSNENVPTSVSDLSLEPAPVVPEPVTPSN
jgi:pilus assembly protein CpaB